MSKQATVAKKEKSNDSIIQNDQMKIRCGKCNLPFWSKEQLEKHALTHEGKKSFDQVKDEKVNILDNESNAMSLGKTKVAYSRSGEEEDTLIVRDLHSGTRFDRFGVKGTAQLERVFYAILDLVLDNRKTLLKRMRYGGDALRNLLDGLSNDDFDGMSTAHDALAPTMKIELKKIDTQPQLALFQYDDDKTLKNGIYLYVSEAVKLVKHMNDVFAFSKSSCLSVFKGTASKVEKYTSDDFF